MAQLYVLLFGKSKKKMKPIMIDHKDKCLAYQRARENSGGQSKAAQGWHKIELAPEGAVVWRQKSCTIGGNKCPRVNRVGEGPPGYISKHGFQPHT